MIGSFGYYFFSGLFGISIGWAIVRGFSDGLRG